VYDELESVMNYVLRNKQATQVNSANKRRRCVMLQQAEYIVPTFLMWDNFFMTYVI